MPHLFSFTRTRAPAQEAEGDLEQLYRRYRGPVLHYLQGLCGSPEVAEELTQETFIRACAGILTFRGEASVATWLFRIARNVYLNSVRRPPSTRIDTEDLLALPDHGQYGDPVRRLDASEQRGRIALAMAQLSEKQRSILILRDVEQLSYAEIADVLEISLAAVKVNLFRARNTFRAAYQALERTEDEA